MNECVVLCVVFISERIKGAKCMKRFCVVVLLCVVTQASYVQQSKDLKEQTNEQRKMVCDLFHSFSNLIYCSSGSNSNCGSMASI